MSDPVQTPPASRFTRSAPSFTINGTAAILLAFYVAAAEKKGVPRDKLTGTIQNGSMQPLGWSRADRFG